MKDDICGSTPLSCLDPSNIFAGIYKRECINFANPNNFQAERSIYNSLIDEMINNYGVDVDYYVHTYNTDSADNFYGEDLDAPFDGPTPLRVLQNYTHNAVPLEIMGFDADDEVVFYVTFDEFERAYAENSVHTDHNQRMEPKADDFFVIKTWGCDRPNGRTAKKFVVTEAIDEDPEELNILMGHYVWRITAKRFDYSHEPNVPNREDKYQVYDNTFAGVLSSDITWETDLECLTDEQSAAALELNNGDPLVDPVEVPQLSADGKDYDYDVDVDVEENIFDQDINDQKINGNTDESSSPYGDYY